jgi:hypothetical protein
MTNPPTLPKPEPLMYGWDIEAIFEKAGGTARLIDLLIKHGFKHPPVGTIYAWKSRKSIPSEWLANIVYALLRNGVGVHEVMVVVKDAPRPEPVE